MKWADYCVSKLSLNENGFIDSIIYYNDLGETLSNNSYEQNRSWMVREVLMGKTFCSIKRNKEGSWNEIGDFSYDGRIFSWKTVPKNIVQRKTFISNSVLNVYKKESVFLKLKVSLRCTTKEPTPYDKFNFILSNNQQTRPF